MAGTRPTVKDVANEVGFLQERIAELELELEDRDYTRLGFGDLTDFELSRQALREITHLSRVFYLKNPLVRRAVDTRTDYVFGRGVTIKAAHPLVDEIVQGFLTDRTNEAEFSSVESLARLDRTLFIDSNLFFVFVSSKSGAVRIRTLPFDEIEDVIRNPEDAAEPWFYLRTTLDGGTGQAVFRLYPDWNHDPDDKPASYPVEGLPQKDIPIEWDKPVYHVSTNRLPGQRFGVSEAYSVQDWAKAYTEFLSDWSTIVKSYARFAWRLTGTKDKIAKVKTAIGSGIPSGTNNPAPSVGSVFSAGSGVGMEPIRTAGATTSAEDGRRLLLMVAAGTGIFEHYFGDPSTGNLATATTMDRPMELSFKARQRLWQMVIEKILRYVIRVKALSGVGSVTGAEIESPDWIGEVEFTLGNDVTNEDPSLRDLPIDDHVDVEFPDILQRNMLEEVTSIVSAATLGGVPLAGTIDLEYLTRRLLIALGETSVEERMADLFPEGWEDEEGWRSDTGPQVTPSSDQVTDGHDHARPLPPTAEASESIRRVMSRLEDWITERRLSVSATSKDITPGT